MIGEMYGLNFFVGEEKFVEAKVVPAKKDETVVISYATYELSKGSGSVTEQGSCEVKGDTVKLLLRTNEIGTYSLKITAKIGLETVIQRVSVSVRR